MASFKLFYKKLLGHEGGYANNKIDIGRETYRGIASKFHPNWAGWEIIKNHKKEWFADGKKLDEPQEWLKFSNKLAAVQPLQAMVQEFYKKLYWDSLSLDTITSQAVAEQLGDHGVNAGTYRVGWMAQWVLRKEFGKTEIVLDGILGPKTIGAINSIDAKEYFTAFTDLRRSFYLYRVGAYLEGGNNVELHEFFRTKLKLKTNVKQRPFLNAWLSRISSHHLKNK